MSPFYSLNGNGKASIGNEAFEQRDRTLPIELNDIQVRIRLNLRRVSMRGIEVAKRIVRLLLEDTKPVEADRDH